MVRQGGHPSLCSNPPALPASEGWLTGIKWWKTDDCREGCSQLPFHWRFFTAARTELLRKQLFNCQATMLRCAQWWRVTTCYYLSRQEGTTTLLGQLPHLTSVSPVFARSLTSTSISGLHLLFGCKLEAGMSAFAHCFPSYSFSIAVHAELSVADQKNASDLGSRTLVLAGEEKQQKTCDRG